MAQFGTSSEDVARRCRDSVASRLPITVIALDEGYAVRVFTGVVQSVDEDGGRAPSSWRVTIIES